jgi:hypothetical protein
MKRLTLLFLILTLISIQTNASMLPEQELPGVPIKSLPPRGIATTDDKLTHTYLYNDFLLRVQGYRVSGLIPEFAVRHKDIHLLYLANAGPLLEDDIKALSAFPWLKCVKIVGCGLNDDLLRVLTDSLPVGLLSLDLADIDLTDAGLLYMVNSGKFNQLSRLSLCCQPHVNKLTCVSLNELAASLMSATLSKIVLFNDAEWTDGLNPAATDFILEKCTGYEKFYDNSFTDGDIYLLDDYLSAGFFWEKHERQWYLTHYTEVEMVDSELAAVDDGQEPSPAGTFTFDDVTEDTDSPAEYADEVLRGIAEWQEQQEIEARASSMLVGEDLNAAVLPKLLLISASRVGDEATDDNQFLMMEGPTARSLSLSSDSSRASRTASFSDSNDDSN